MHYYFKVFLGKAIPLLLFLTINNNVLQAQNYPSDCSQALNICQLGDYYFADIKGEGIQENLHLTESQIKETNSIWLQFEVLSQGDLDFVIIPENRENDFDFVLYEGETCSDLSPLRIMTSGQIFGEESTIECLGQTGLRDKSYDESESDGCFDFDDNFLKPVRLKEGKNYYLLINNFNSSEGFSVLFSGDGQLAFLDKCNKGQDVSNFNFDVFPNPVIDRISIRSKVKIKDPVEIVMFDLSGRIILKKEFKDMLTEKQLDVSNFSAGEYYMRIVSTENVGLKSFIKM